MSPDNEFSKVFITELWDPMGLWANESQVVPAPLPESTGKKRKKITTKNAMDHIKTDRQGVWAELHKLQKKQKREVFEKKKRKKIKSAVEKYQEENARDNTEANIIALTRMTKLGKVGNQLAKKILYRKPCQLSCDVKEEIQEKEEMSVFTEEDFKKFEKEYHPK